MPGPFAISNRLSLRFKPEGATYGAIPGSGNHYALRVTGEQLKYNLITAVSAELRSDRMTADVIPVDGQAEGSLPFEISYGEFDSILQSLLAGAWAATAGAGGESAAMTATITTSNAVAASAGTPFSAVVVGQYISFTGFATPANNNNPLKVATITGGGLGVTFTGTPLVNEASVAGVKFRAARLINGTTLSPFDVERVNNDLTQFEAFRGMVPNKGSIDFKIGSILTASIDWMGKDALPMAATTAMPGSLTASLTNPVLNSVSSLSGFQEGGAALSSTYVQSMKINVNNNCRPIKGLGNLGAVGIQLGECDVDGEIVVYLADASLYNKYLLNTLTSLAFVLKDSAGNAYVIQLPAIKYQSAERMAGGKNQDIMLKLGFQTIRDAATNSHIVIDRCGSIVTLWA